jgi:predicted Zn-dependent protease
LRGETEAARAAYVDLVERTGNPEFMDALAEILAATGDADGAKVWVRRATEAYAARMHRFPEAAYGHALEHALEHGTPAESLDLAEKNHTLRPNAEAKILLARARLRAGDPKGARQTIEAALATPVRTAELHAVAAAIYRALDNETRAVEHRAEAIAINPAIEVEL